GILAEHVVPKIVEWQNSIEEDDVPSTVARFGRLPRGVSGVTVLVAAQLDRESTMAGYLLHLRETGQFNALRALLYKQDLGLTKIKTLLEFRDPLDYVDPFTDIDRVGLSPIGIVHLFRQYFFELDTFLGPPVSHVWLSPGSTVELMEVNTRRTLVERSVETFMETIVKAEKSTTEEDEISDAVKDNNKSDTKFGMSTTANQSWVTGSATATGSLNIDATQEKARENSHRHMRQQTEKLSTEIRKNFRSTFRTVTETTDVSSKRYVLANTATDADLVNYELRRKMRQVGVQVQDIGTYLCWQTYVDDPGRQLGISKLVHLAKDPEVGTTPPPEAIPMPDDVVTPHTITIPFQPLTEDTEPSEDMDEAYKLGTEVNLDTNEGDPERIQYRFRGLSASCDKPGYEFKHMTFDYKGNDIVIEGPTDLIKGEPGKITYGIVLAHVNFRNNSPLLVEAKVTWTPTNAVATEVNAKNAERIKEFNEASKREFQKAFVEAARDRINKASRVGPRKFEDLREEERIVVYRSLIQNMLTKGIPMPDDRTRHVVSELLNAIFDIDKMLYFVAPEWWRPRLHQSHQGLGGLRKKGASGAVAEGGAKDAMIGPASSVYENAQRASWEQTRVIRETLEKARRAEREDDSIAAVDTVSWGGVGEGRADNYYITEDSEPAKLGSSLGWLLQLDGDNMRNAFLNAPWVKAVIPIRPGKEHAAINWLQRLHVEGSEGLGDDYVAPERELKKIPHKGATVTIRDAIEHLCATVATKHEKAKKVSKYPKEEIDDSNRVSATPIDKVYEHGFYPLKGGFKVAPGDDEAFEVFDQWVEVLPTDQVVPVEVTYDPKTGRQP
ncbi:MAG TPA: hypothetical protein VF711_01520, partial [Acidimicrobiales bacterium]